MNDIYSKWAEQYLGRPPSDDALQKRRELLWYDCVSTTDNGGKRRELQEKLTRYESKLAQKMKRYRGVIHESGLSEMRHNEVMVLRAIVTDLKREIQKLVDTE